MPFFGAEANTLLLSKAAPAVTSAPVLINVLLDVFINKGD
jgi:hypothetical protein